MSILLPDKHFLTIERENDQISAPVFPFISQKVMQSNHGSANTCIFCSFISDPTKATKVAKSPNNQESCRPSPLLSLITLHSTPLQRNSVNSSRHTCVGRRRLNRTDVLSLVRSHPSAWATFRGRSRASSRAGWRSRCGQRVASVRASVVRRHDEAACDPAS